MSIRTLVIILIVLILIPVIMERVKVSFSDFFTHPKDAFPTLIKSIWDFYRNLIGNWMGGWINNLIEEKIKGKKIEIQLK